MARKHDLAEPKGKAKSASASGDTRQRRRRGTASIEVGKSASASGDRVMTSVYSHGVRIRCWVDRRQELTDAVRARRCSRSVWDPESWRQEVNAIKAKMGDLGVGTHGGSRAKPLATGNTGLDTDTGKRKSTDRDSDNVLASGNKDRSIKQLASGNKDRGIDQLASGNKDRSVDQLAPGNTDRGIDQVASGNKDRGIDQVASSSKSLAIGSTGSTVAQRIVRYELGYRLLGPASGQGSFGTVFPVIWKAGQDSNDIGELAVVKHVPIEQPFVGPSVQEAREIEITSTLAHDNVVRLLQAIQTPFAVDLAFEHCSCDMLHAMRSSMELGSRPQILAQICRGLAYVHGEGIMHRDLKPSNILLQSRPGGKFVAKIADFWFGEEGAIEAPDARRGHSRGLGG